MLDNGPHLSPWDVLFLGRFVLGRFVSASKNAGKPSADLRKTAWGQTLRWPTLRGVRLCADQHCVALDFAPTNTGWSFCLEREVKWKLMVMYSIIMLWKDEKSESWKSVDTVSFILDPGGNFSFVICTNTKWLSLITDQHSPESMYVIYQKSLNYWYSAETDFPPTNTAHILDSAPTNTAWSFGVVKFAFAGLSSSSKGIITKQILMWMGYTIEINFFKYNFIRL